MVKTDKQTEEQIFEAAERVFTNKGLHGARMQEIADEAGINKALLHYYFRSKDKLFEAVFNNTFKKFFPNVLNTLMDEKMSLEQKIEKIVVSYIDEFKNKPSLPMFILFEIHQNPKILQDLGDKLAGIRDSRFMHQYKQGVLAGKYMDVNPIHIMLNILSMSVFPILAKPMIEQVFGLKGESYMAFLEERKQVVPKMIIQNITISK